MRWAGLLFIAACKTTEPTTEPLKPPPPKARENAVRVRVAPFDVSACAKPTPLAPVTKETLAALLDAERPRFEACLVPPSAREKLEGSATLDVAVTVKEASVKVTPRDVTPEGVGCLESAVKTLALAGASAGAQLTVSSPPGSPDPTIQLLPEANTLRAAVTSACGCFELGVNAPPPLVLTIGPASALDVVTSADPISEKVERCLEAALAAHPKPTVELTLDLPLINADAAALSPDASPEILALQDQAMKRRHSAEVVLLDARRTALLKQLEPIAASYKRKPTPKLTRERQTLCEAILEIEESLPVALERAKNADLTKNVSTEPAQLCAFARTAEEE